MSGDRETGQSAGDNSRVEELILDSLRRIEKKVEDGFSEQGRRITALEITSGQHALELRRLDAFGGRLVPWLMLGWNVVVSVAGVIGWLVSIHR